MALQPSDLTKPSAKEKELITKLEQQIDAALLASYSGEGSFTIDIGYQNKRVMDALKIKYHGWELRNENYLEMTPIKHTGNYWNDR